MDGCTKKFLDKRNPVTDGIQVKTKVSRGTQVLLGETAAQGESITELTCQKSGKSLSITPNIQKKTGPPVPPKPSINLRQQASLKLPPLPKPQLPPKPTLPATSLKKFSPQSSPSTRCKDSHNQTSSPSSSRHPNLSDEAKGYLETRKSANLKRFEIKKYSAPLKEDWKVDLKSQLAYESGYVSCSLESLNQALLRLSGENAPKPPPRRRRKSFGSQDPIYAVIDFSKKLNRRKETTQSLYQEVNHKPISQISKSMIVNDQPNTECNITVPDSTTYGSEQEEITQTKIKEPNATSQNLENRQFSEISRSTTTPALEDDTSEPKLYASKIHNVETAEVKTNSHFHDSHEEYMIAKLSPNQWGTRRLAVKNKRCDKLKTLPKNTENYSNKPSSFSKVSSPSSPQMSSSSSDNTKSDLHLSSSCDPDSLSVSSFGDSITSESISVTSLTSINERFPDDKNLDSPQEKPYNQMLGLQTNGVDSDLTSIDTFQKTFNSEELNENKPADTTHSKNSDFHPPSSCINSARKLQNRAVSSGTLNSNELEKPKALVFSTSLMVISASQESHIARNEPTGAINEPANFNSQNTTVGWNVSSCPDAVNDTLQSRERKAFLRATEIASSEKVFVECLGLICDGFRKALKQASEEYSEILIPNNELNKILSYLPQLYNLNQDILKDFEARIKDWGKNPKISDVIVRKGPFLKMFSAYIRDFPSQSALLDECILKFPKFGKIVREFEQTEQCKNLSLKHYMLKPVQRLPQYRLLLEAYLKHLDENSVDYHDTQIALKIVTDVAEHANNSMKIEDNFQKLLHLQSRLSNCEIIRPGRKIIKEGELYKVSRKSLQLRYFILLNDSLLYTSFTGHPTPSSGLKLHHELPLEDVDTRKSPLAGANENSYEFSVISTTRSFTVVASSEAHRQEWMDALNDAVSQCKSNKMTFPSQVCLEKIEFKLGSQAPIWIPDRRVTMCQLCTAEFSLTFRRHHCRACGKVVCRNCSSHQAPLRYLQDRRARVCDSCFYAINRESGLVEKIMTGSKKSIVNLAYETSSITVPTALVADAFNEESVLCKELPAENPINQPSFRRNVPHRLSEVTAGDTESHVSGFLSRRTKRGWKKSWYVLKNQVLYRYKAPEDVLALDTLPVLGYQVKVPSEASSETQGNLFQLCHEGVLCMFQADDAVIAKRWVDALVKNTSLK